MIFYRFEKQVAGFGQASHQEDGFWAGDGNGVGQSFTQHFSGIFESIDSDHIAFLCSFAYDFRIHFIERDGSQFARIVIFSHHFISGAFYSRGRYIGLQTTATSATTLAAVGRNDGMTEFSGKAVVSVNQFAVDYESTTQTGT